MILADTIKKKVITTNFITTSPEILVMGQDPLVSVAELTQDKNAALAQKNITL